MNFAIQRDLVFTKRPESPERDKLGRILHQRAADREAHAAVHHSRAARHPAPPCSGKRR